MKPGLDSIVKSPERFVVDFWVTGRCDMECPFCYGADVPSHSESSYDEMGRRRVVYYYGPEGKPEMDFTQIQQVILKLKSAGVNTLTIAGGEPLLRRDTPNIIAFAHQAGMEVYLSSNGTFLLRPGVYDEIKHYISTLGLPLDGSTPDINILMGRRPYLYDNIRGILAYFSANRPPHKVKIGTVVSKVNIHDLRNIGDFLFRTPEQYKPDVWRLYQFEPLKRGRENQETYAISMEEFQSAIEKLKTIMPEAPISARSNDDHVNAYFFVTPQGHLQVVDTEHRDIADLLTISPEELIALIEEHKQTQVRAGRNRDWLG